MTQFDKLFARTAGPSLMRQFGEQIVYFKHNDPDGPRYIQAIVDRMSPEHVAGTDQQAAPRFKITVYNCWPDGISLDELDTDLDQIGIFPDPDPEKSVGVEPIRVSIMSIPPGVQAGGMIDLSLQ